MFNYHCLIPWGSFRGRQEEKWGSFRGWDHFGVDLEIISGLWIISGSGLFRGLYRTPEPEDHWQTPLTEEHLYSQRKHTQSNKSFHSLTHFT